MEATVQKPLLRWIPNGMDICYLQVGRGSKFTATATLDAEEVTSWIERATKEKNGKIQVVVPVAMLNDKGEQVATADVRCQVSRKSTMASKL